MSGRSDPLSRAMKKEPEPEQTSVIPTMPFTEAEFKAPVYKSRRAYGIKVLSDGTWVRRVYTREGLKEIKAEFASFDAAEDADAFLKRKMPELGFSDKE